MAKMVKFVDAMKMFDNMLCIIMHHGLFCDEIMMLGNPDGSIKNDELLIQAYLDIFKLRMKPIRFPHSDDEIRHSMKYHLFKYRHQHIAREKYIRRWVVNYRNKKMHGNQVNN